MKYCRLKQPDKSSKATNVIGLLLALPRVVTALRHSKSQLGQDLFALCELGFKENGYFVEFGATNGVNLSNSCLLEKQFGWTGIVAEPALRWHKDLTNNRKCHIETDCVWRESNSVLSFNKTGSGEYSTIESYSSAEVHKELRKNGKTYNINTISLEDMLAKYNAPREIDYLSIDTEGSEYEILSNFNFDKYKFRTITCEHNFTPDREKIFSLLTSNGYVRKLEGCSRFDDWYVRAV